MTTANKNIKRVSFGKIREPLEVPDMLDVQRDSFNVLVGSTLAGEPDPASGLDEILADVSPIEDYSGTMSLTLSAARFEPVKYSVRECKERDLTYCAPLFVNAELVNTSSGEIKSQTVFMGDFPLMTPAGTFVINGTERVVVSQLVRSPGVYFERVPDKASGRDVFSARVIPSRGAWLEFEVDKRDAVGVRIDRKRKQPVTVLLKAIGLSEADIAERYGHSEALMSTLEKDHTSDTEEALLEIYRRLRPGEPPTKDGAATLLNNLYFNPRRYDLAKVGRYKVNKKLGVDVTTERGELTPEDVLATLDYLLALHAGEAEVNGRVVEPDDIDHLGNRRLRSVGELIANQLRLGLVRLERVVRERMTTQDPENITPQSLINIRPVVAAIREFYGSSQLSQFLDQNNPLSGVTHKRRLSALGPGGLSRERAGMEVRDVHTSHYGRMCPIESPEGPNIGLIGSLASYGRINAFGFIETPYREVKDGVVTDDVVYLSADEESGRVIAQANAPLTDSGAFAEERVLVRSPLGEAEFVPRAEVDLMDVSPRQMVSPATALIPFLEHDDANRALMGANMQRQAVPLLRAEAPLVGTGMESRLALDAGEVLRSEVSGVVSEVSAALVVVTGDDGREHAYQLDKFTRSNAGNSYNSRVLVDEGDVVAVGTPLADGPSTDGGELALGKNLVVAFMSWEGHNYEDAIILSQRLVADDTLTSIHIAEHEVDTRDTKLGAEEITRDIPNTSEEVLADLDERGIIRIGAEVVPGDVLVGKVTPKGETELTPEERLLRAIFGEKAREVRDTSLRVPHGESGTVIGVTLFDRDAGDELSPGVHQMVRVHIASKRKISEGDKLAGRHGNKGVISTILPVEDMPFLEDGTPVDVVLNPLGVPGRMNVGQVLELHLGWIAKEGWKVEGDPEWALQMPEGIRAAAPGTPIATPVFDGVERDELTGLLASTTPNRDGQRLVSGGGKARLFDGRSGEPFPMPVSVGVMYILKLHHLVDDKIHARSTGPYSMITQQPLGGKAQFGGQRFGEMEVWALEAYGAAYTLQELLTIKSDDVVGRVNVYESIVKGENIPEPGIPESFKVLMREMQSLCLNVEVLSADGSVLDLSARDEDGSRAAEELGIDISHRENSSIEGF